jgi:ketosteroid isomerase-like protein
MFDRIRALLPLTVILFAGCASSPNSSRTADSPTQTAQIQARLNEILDACVKKDFDRLDSYHLYGPKFTKFSTAPPERQDAETGRKGEHDGLSAANGLKMKADDLRIDVFGDTAIATFVLKYGFQTDAGPIEKQARSTLVFVNDRGQWRIAHEHLSAVNPVTP